MVRAWLRRVALAPAGDEVMRPFWSRYVTHTSTRELGIMTISSTQTGTEEPIVWTAGQGTTRNLPPAMVTMVFIGVSCGRCTETPSMARSCTIIALPVALLSSCRSYDRLPPAVPMRQISPSGSVIGTVGYWMPLSVKYHLPPVKLLPSSALLSWPGQEP